MKLINYIIVAVASFALAACTSSDILDYDLKDTMAVTKSDDLETLEVKLETAGTLAEKLGDKKNTVQKLILSGPVDADDVMALRNMPKLSVLDIKGTEFVETEKTYSTNVHTGCAHKLEKGKIGDCMFSGYDGGKCQLVSIILPDNIVSIGNSAFFCSPLKSIILPEGLKTIGKGAFDGAEQLGTIVLPKSLTAIGSRAFLNCYSLSTIEIPEKITKIGDYTFSHTGLRTIIIPDGVTAIGADCFVSCKVLEEVHLSSSLKTIGNGAFRYCQSLKTIDIPNTVTQIEHNAFEKTALESIKLPDNLQVLSQYMFSGCPLKEVKLPANLSVIERFTFNGCSFLKSLDIPANTKKIESEVFRCIRLSSIFVNGKTTLNDIFIDPTNCLIYLSDPTTNISSNLINVIINGVAPTLILKDIQSDFFCPREFKAMKTTYTKTFKLKTIPGQSGGWYSLSLPFNVTSITHEDGRVLAPFNSGVPNAKPFWLRKLTANGFENATSIEAGESYIIAMPNNEKYAKEYNLAGKVTFSAQNPTDGIVIPVTKYKRVEGLLFDFNASYEIQEKSASVYLLNAAGSAFQWSLRDSKPFEAYVTNKDITTKAPAMFSIGGNAKTRSTHTVSSKPSIDDM